MTNNCLSSFVLGKQTSWNGVVGQHWKTGGGTKPNCKTPDMCGQHYERTGTQTFSGPSVLTFSHWGFSIMCILVLTCWWFDFLCSLFSSAFSSFSLFLCFILLFLWKALTCMWSYFLQFGDLDPGSADFFLQEERIKQLRTGYEAQYRVIESKSQKGAIYWKI